MLCRRNEPYQMSLCSGLEPKRSETDEIPSDHWITSSPCERRFVLTTSRRIVHGAAPRSPDNKAISIVSAYNVRAAVIDCTIVLELARRYRRLFPCRDLVVVLSGATS